MSPPRIPRVIPAFVALAIAACSPAAPGLLANDEAPELVREAKPPMGAPILGEGCAEEGSAACADAGFDVPSVLRCVGGSWALEAVCSATCEGAGQCSAGCAVVRGDPAPRCLCAPLGPNCPGSIHCESHHTLSVPNGQEEALTIECLEACGETPGGFSLGCGFSPGAGRAECRCAALGGECAADEEGRACVGAPVTPSGSAPSATLEIARCDAGAWSALSCAALCDDADAQCWRRKEGPDVCSCEA